MFINDDVKSQDGKSNLQAQIGAIFRDGKPPIELYTAKKKTISLANA